MGNINEQIGEDPNELLQARIKNQEKSVEQARMEVEEAIGDQKVIWENRLKQCEEELDQLKQEAGQAPEQEKAA